MSKKTQLWQIGDEPENCIPLGQHTAGDYGLASDQCIRARTASEAIRRADARRRSNDA